MKKEFATRIIIYGLIQIAANVLCGQEFYGTTSVGGISYYLGTIFKTDGEGNNFSMEYSSVSNGYGKYPASDLYEASNGKLYGTTTDGGIYDRGALFEFDPSSSEITLKVSFEYTIAGDPTGRVVETSNGKLYGMSKWGGDNSFGTIYAYDPLTETFEVKYSFKDSTGINPLGCLLAASNGLLYGMTSTGGADYGGVVFEFDPATDIYTKKIDLNSTIGRTPYGSFIEASDGLLYGMTYRGGSHNLGVIFRYDPQDEQISTLYSFSSGTGSHPKGDLLEANDGKLYGMTYYGGISDQGVLFNFDPVTNNYTKIIDFTGWNGLFPCGSLVQANDSIVLGMTSEGGDFDKGVIFSYNINTGSFSNKIDFNQTNGSLPQGTIIKKLNGQLLGMTYAGGFQNKGTIFNYELESNSLNTLVDFTEINDGSHFSGKMLYLESDKLYGMAPDGGENNEGVLFSYDPEDKVYTKLVDFADSLGTHPYGSLTKAPNGKLYGMTSEGGSYGQGVLFSYDLITENLSVLVSFNGSGNGSMPRGSLTLGNDVLFYGLTSYGGINNDGVVFSYNYLQNNLEKLADFDSLTTGTHPNGSLVQHSNGNFYGMTYRGGATYFGVLFEFDPEGNGLHTKHGFNFATGIYPKGDLVEFDSMLYGMTPLGGLPEMEGVLFRYDPTNDIFDVKYQFTIETGYHPQGSLLLASNNKLYGMTTEGYFYGSLFEYDPQYDVFTIKNMFYISTGGRPLGTLTEIPLGVNIYENNFEDDIGLFPNPADQTLKIISKKNITFRSAEIVDLMGRKVIRKEFSAGEKPMIDISKLQPGIYLLSLSSAENRYSVKFVKK